MSPTAHSRSPARERSSTSTCSASGSRPDRLQADVGEVVGPSGRDEQLVGDEVLAVDGHREPAVVVDPLDLDADPHVDALVAAAPPSAAALASGSSAGSDPVAPTPAGSPATPNRANACASSTPLGPPPTTTKVSGTSRSPSSPRGWSSTASPSSPSIGGRAGSVPVLRTTPRAASKATGPASVSTRTRPGPSSRPWPRTIRTPASSSGSAWWWSVQSWLASRIRAATSDQSGRRSTSPGQTGDAPAPRRAGRPGGPSASRACSPRTGTRRPPGPARPRRRPGPPRPACARRTRRRGRARAPRRRPGPGECPCRHLCIHRMMGR